MVRAPGYRPRRSRRPGAIGPHRWSHPGGVPQPLSAPPILRPLRGRLWIMGSSFPGSSTPGYRIFDASGVAPMALSPPMPSVHDRLSAARPIRGLPAMEKVAGGWFVPPDRDRLSAAQPIRGLPAMEKVAGGWFVPPVDDPEGVADPIAPGRRPGETGTPTVAPRRGATPPFGSPDSATPAGSALDHGFIFPGVFDPGLPHLRRLRRRSDSLISGGARIRSCRLSAARPIRGLPRWRRLPGDGLERVLRSPGRRGSPFATRR